MTALGFFKTHEDVTLPKFATQESACFDLAAQFWGKSDYKGFDRTNKPITRNFVSGFIIVMPGDRLLVPTGLILDIPQGFSVRLHARSGLSYKKGIVLANQEAVIDSDYVEEMFILITNHTDIPFKIENGDRIAQGELVRTTKYDLVEVETAPGIKTDRKGGLGSTGINKIEEKEDSPSTSTK